MEGKNPTVSIIIPVYNAENYLARCVDSVLGQEYTDFELLLVDDGSEDASGSLCDAYARSDSRIRVFHKENAGVSAARNQALSEARGTFIQFLDSDDWMTPDSTKLLVRAAEEKNCDLVIADFYRVVGERVSRKGDIEEEGVMSREEFASHMMENPADYYYGVLWNKLYRRSLIEAHTLRMHAEVSWCEDFLFNLEYLRFAGRITALHAPIYYYVKRKGSLVATQGTGFTKTIRMKLSVFAYYHNFYRNVLDDEEYEKNRLQLYRFLVDAAGDGMVGIPLLPGTRKLGDERSGVSAAALAGEGVLSDQYRERKLMQRYLEVAALKNDLTSDEAYLLLCLRHLGSAFSKKELADFVGVSKRTIHMQLQKLVQKGLIKVEDIPVPKPVRSKKEKGTAKDDPPRKAPEKRVRVTFLPEAEPILRELSTVQHDYDAVRFADFEEEDLIQYARLTEKMKRNIQKVLVPKQ